MIVVIDYREKELHEKCLALIEKTNHGKEINLLTENLSIGDIIIKDDSGKDMIEKFYENQENVNLRNSIISSNSSIKQNKIKNEQVLLLGEGTKILF